MSYRGWLAGAGALAVLVAGANMYRNKLVADLAAANVKQRSAATVATVRKPVALITLPAPALTRPSPALLKVRSNPKQDLPDIAQKDSDQAARQDALFYTLQAATQPVATVSLVATQESPAEQTFALAALDSDKGTNPVTNTNLATATSDIPAVAPGPATPANGLIYVDHLVPSVPEPDSHSLILAGLGLLGLAARTRRGKHLQQSAGETNTL